MTVAALISCPFPCPLYLQAASRRRRVLHGVSSTAAGRHRPATRRPRSASRPPPLDALCPAPTPTSVRPSTTSWPPAAVLVAAGGVDLRETSSGGRRPPWTLPVPGQHPWRGDSLQAPRTRRRDRRTTRCWWTSNAESICGPPPLMTALRPPFAARDPRPDRC